MRRYSLIFFLLAAAVSCSRPSSVETFIQKENAEYGDTYSYTLDLKDSTCAYGLTFYTRLERRPFKEYKTDSLRMRLTWIHPTHRALTETLVMPLSVPVDSTFRYKDFVCRYKGGIRVPEYGTWHLVVHVLNSSDELRGLGIICAKK